MLENLDDRIYLEPPDNDSQYSASSGRVRSTANRKK